jgi:apolipoprotein D and lipocalin family protein
MSFNSPATLTRALKAVLLAITLAAFAACSTTTLPPGVQAVTPFELQRYQGRWFEIARLDHRFERGMSDVSATYTPQSDGSVRVVNRGYVESSNSWKEALGRALFIGAPTTGSLKVSFFGPFYGGYHVAALDQDYRWALVVGPDVSYCWILARDKQLTPAQRATILSKAQAIGVNIDALIWVSQARQDPS